MGLFHSCLKLKTSKHQTDDVAFRSASSPETCISHHPPAPRLGGVKLGNGQAGEGTSHQQDDLVANLLG